MKKRILALSLLLIILISYIAIPVSAVYDVEVSNGRPVPILKDDNGNKYVNGGTGTFIQRYKLLIVFAGGLATISMVAAALYNVMRLNLTMSNPMQRQQCIRGILVCGFFAALLGSATMFVGLFYGLLR